MVKGIVIIPENNSILSRECPSYGYPHELIKTDNFEDINEFAKRHNYEIMYLMSKHRLLYSDDFVKNEFFDITKDKDTLLIWSALVANDIEKECYRYYTNQVYLMNRNISKFQFLLRILKSKGIEVHCPICGVPRHRIKLVLSVL